ncbi:hypothetical protein [Acetobacter sicerae]|uniref:hypothetical protein n=1 Tax=Acetobacter sicerae TaxID=85325 RepID=UPI00156AF1F2|nr:hypothetical protein [Acetobacter sicerae]NHN92317.1 hypothetical protein [Acetobacter sicerae]
MKVSVSIDQAKDLEQVVDAWCKWQADQGLPGYVKRNGSGSDKRITYTDLPSDLFDFVGRMLPNAELD